MKDLITNRLAYLQRIYLKITVAIPSATGDYRTKLEADAKVTSTRIDELQYLLDQHDLLLKGSMSHRKEI